MCFKIEMEYKGRFIIIVILVIIMVRIRVNNRLLIFLKEKRYFDECDSYVFKDRCGI